MLTSIRNVKFYKNALEYNVHHRCLCYFLKNFSTFSYKLVQISPIMILVNSGAFLSISSWFCELTELIFVMIPYISSSGYPPKRKGLWVMCK